MSVPPLRAVTFQTALPFVLLLTAVLGLWIHRFVWTGALIAAVAAGYYTGALHGFAALWIALTAALALVYAHARASAQTGRGRVLQMLAGAVFFLFALAMGLALLPGFQRVELAAPQVLSPGAMPYGIAVGFPKVVTGILILGLINSVLGPGIGQALKRGLPVFALTVVVAMACVLAMGYTAFAPKWTAFFWVWAPINLFFTCLSEEAFFRGFVQHELARTGTRNMTVVALIVAAVLFGLAHFGGGVQYAIAATVAGLGYGWAFLRTQRIEAAMAVHFGVNATHFLLFAYPRLA
jgi:membrane protease YdiL (CAAX protease family)